MDAFLESLQQSAFARFVGESGSLLGYPTVLFLHTLGLGTVAGVSAVLALRVVGFGRNVPFELLDRLFPIMWIGFILSAISGLALLVTDPVTKLHQTVFYVKLILVALAVVNMQMMRTRIFHGPAAGGAIPSNGRLLAFSSLIFWIGATTAGRLIAYL
jgi:hypothetical protein